MPDLEEYKYEYPNSETESSISSVGENDKNLSALDIDKFIEDKIEQKKGIKELLNKKFKWSRRTKSTI